MARIASDTGMAVFRVHGMPPDPISDTNTLMIQMIDKDALECWRKAGKIASECREWARVNIKPGVKLR